MYFKKKIIKFDSLEAEKSAFLFDIVDGLTLVFFSVSYRSIETEVSSCTVVPPATWDDSSEVPNQKLSP